MAFSLGRLSGCTIPWGVWGACKTKLWAVRSQCRSPKALPAIVLAKNPATATRAPSSDSFLLELQQHSNKVEKAEARVQEQQNEAREAFQQASAHARSAQQAEARCQVLEQAVQRAERKAEATAQLQHVSSFLSSVSVNTGTCRHNSAFVI